jgi:hypothetical protein
MQGFGKIAVERYVDLGFVATGYTAAVHKTTDQSWQNSRPQAPRHADVQAASVAVSILELVRHRHQAVHHLPAAMKEEPAPVAWAVAPMQRAARVPVCDMRVHVDMVETEPRSTQLLQDWHDRGVCHKVSVRPIPVQDGAFAVSKVLIRAGAIVLYSLGVPLELGHRICMKKPGKHDEPVQVKQIRLRGCGEWRTQWLVLQP